jgi:hypothetical protein
MRWDYPFAYFVYDDFRIITGLGFEWIVSESGFGGFNIPYSSLDVMAAIVPAYHYWRKRSRRPQSSDGLCKNCGYDPRASLKRCPECGTTRPKKNK